MTDRKLQWAMIASLAVIPVWAAATAAHAQQDDMIGVDWIGNVYTINSSTGAGSLLGASGFSQMNAMGKAPDGAIYATSGLNAITIIRIDPNTGVGTFVSNTSVNSVRSAAFAPDGTMYVTDDVGFGSPDSLWTVDPGTGQANLIGSTGLAGIQAMAIDSQGVIYAWDLGGGTGLGLVTLDPTTGAATDVNANVGGGGEIQALCFDGHDNLFGVRDSVYSIDVTTGVETTIGTGGYSDVRGADFLGGGAPPYTIDVSGTCPGNITVRWSGAEANAVQALLFSRNTGNFVIPGGACAGTQIGLDQHVMVVKNMPTGGSGSGSTAGHAPPAACGGFLQLITGGSCATSNVAQIP